MAAKETSGKGKGSSEDELRVAAAREVERKGLVKKAKLNTKINPEISEWVEKAAPTKIEEFHNFSKRPLTEGEPRPWTFAKDQATADKLNAPIFPDGKAPYEKTKIEMPKLGADGQGNPTVIPSSIGNQYLQRIPGGAEKFVAEQKANFKEARSYATGERNGEADGFGQIKGKDGNWMLDPDKEAKRKETLRRTNMAPMPNMIDFDRRDAPVPITDIKDGDPRYYVQRNKIAGVDPFQEGLSLHEKTPSSLEEVSLRYKNGVPPAGPVNPSSAVQVLGHEANHSYLNTSMKHPFPGGSYEGEPSSNPDFQDPDGAGAYQTSDDSEWAQGVTSGLNGMRDITGRKLNTPYEVHKLLDEVEKNPEVLDNLNDENARIFRSYLKINKENPESGKRMRESIARDSKYLVQNEAKPLNLEQQGKALVANYFRSPDPLMG